MAERGLTQVALCADAGVCRQTLSHAYHGTRLDAVPVGAWIAIAQALGVQVGEIAPSSVAAAIVAVA